MESSSASSASSSSSPLNDTVTTVLSQQELRRKRLAALGVAANQNTNMNTEQQPRKRRAVEKKAKAVQAPDDVIDLCDDSDDNDNDDDDGMVEFARKLEHEKIAGKERGTVAASFATVVACPAATASGSTSTVATASGAGLSHHCLDDSSSDEEDNVEFAQRLEREIMERLGKKKRAGPSSKASSASSSKASASAAASTKVSASLSNKSSDSNSFHWQVATYNVWFGPNGRGDPHPDDRMSAACRELLQPQPQPEASSQSPPLLFCGFQEVVPALAEPIHRVMQASGYRIFSQPGDHYGCALAVLARGPGAVTVLDAGWQGFKETNMARGFLHVRARLPMTTDGDGNEQQVLFTTTHLESWTGKDSTGQTQRVKQLQEMEAFCNQQLATYPNLQTAIITGDLNWDDERRIPTDDSVSSVLRTEWKDAWLETRPRPKDTCYTYDGKLNPMLSNSLRRRFDRVLIRCSRGGTSTSMLAVPTATRMIGTQAIPGLTFQKQNPYTQTSRQCPVAPSDHFGFVAQLKTSLS